MEITEKMQAYQDGYADGYSRGFQEAFAPKKPLLPPAPQNDFIVRTPVRETKGEEKCQTTKSDS